MAFCSECGNLYDISNIAPDDNTTSEEQQPKQKGGRKDYGIQSKMYFVCSTCRNTELIRPKTLIVSKQSDDIAKNYYVSNTRPENLVKVQSLFHTREYICPNASCTSHKKPETRDAVMSRIGNTYKMQYTCTLCLTAWN
jgi:hypothetical protein